jgi:hypothetical protein
MKNTPDPVFSGKADLQTFVSYLTEQISIRDNLVRLNINPIS